LEQARLRAIEQGLPLVRAADNGISAVIDPLDRMIWSLPLGSEGLLDAQLPRAITPDPLGPLRRWSRRVVGGGSAHRYPER
jgi:apolipoprotein N-acyltransferase